MTQVVRRLLCWFQQNARDLPWRRTNDPYAIWISEVMLQQTQVKTVLPYWERWMRALPAIGQLADAPVEQLHKLWEGLGYYSRVRNLQKAAQTIMQRHEGIFPRKFEDVLALPGIGPYTAGAICSIAFDKPAPIVDGNVTRVLSRLFAIGGDPREPATKATLWDLAGRGVKLAAALEISAKTPQGPLCSYFNQALMELGATICTPREPSCGRCPVAIHCKARQDGCAANYPALSARPASTALHYVAVLAKRRGRYLVRQRPPGVVNAHLWEFPSAQVSPAEPLSKAARSLLGIQNGHFSTVMTLKHTITRFRITLTVLQADTPEKPAAQGAWIPLAKLQALPFCSAHKKILERVAGL